MRRQAVAACAALALLAFAEPARAAENFYVRTYVPTFAGPGSLGANVSTIITLRLWTTLRVPPLPNPNNLNFGVGQIEWSRRVIGDSPDAAVSAAIENKSHLALWGAVERFGPGVVVTPNIVIPTGPQAMVARDTWTVSMRNVRLVLGLPNNSYQFSALVIADDLIAKYSRPNEVKVCPTKVTTCNGSALRAPFRSLYLEGDFVRVRQAGGNVGWVWLPDLSEAQGEVVDFTAALISYLRGDFEQAGRYFEKVSNDKAESLVRNDASLLAGISQFRFGKGVETLKAAHEQNPYSRYGMQALVMAYLASAQSLRRDERRDTQVKEATRLVQSYRHLFEPDDPWLVNADRAVRALN